LQRRLGLAFVRIATGLLVLVAGWSLIASWDAMTLHYGRDLSWYLDAVRRWLGGDGWFQARQLTGPYVISSADVLYPPTLVWLLLPWLVLPAWTFIAIPIGITAWAVYRLRPPEQAWPLLAACLIWPATNVKIASANPGLWIMAAVALGTVFRWPAAFALLKPTVAVFGLIGSNRAGWWRTVGFLGLLSLPMTSDVLRYPQVLLDARGGGFYYSIWDLPMLLLPALAWASAGCVPQGATPIVARGLARAIADLFRGRRAWRPVIGLPGVRQRGLALVGVRFPSGSRRHQPRG
jgi:hypothetical protein